MNFYNPYYSIPFDTTPKIGILQRLFGKTGVSISNFLNGTQKVLNFANQTIPIVRQVKPMIGNAKTMFRVMNEFKKTEKTVENNGVPEVEPKIEEKNNIIENKPNNNNEGPIFFI